MKPFSCKLFYQSILPLKRGKKLKIEENIPHCLFLKISLRWSWPKVERQVSQWQGIEFRVIMGVIRVLLNLRQYNEHAIMFIALL